MSCISGLFRLSHGRILYSAPYAAPMPAIDCDRTRTGAFLADAPTLAQRWNIFPLRRPQKTRDDGFRLEKDQFRFASPCRF